MQKAHRSFYSLLTLEKNRGMSSLALQSKHEIFSVLRLSLLFVHQKSIQLKIQRHVYEKVKDIGGR